jgi:hypothetical protein
MARRFQVNGLKKGSPYIINGEAIVPSGKTLEIKPGVVVRFKTGESRPTIMTGHLLMSLF